MSAKVRKYGIDVSEWQGANFDFSKYKDRFVIIRLMSGSRLDKQAENYIAKCEKLGIPYGFYHYSYALNEDQAREEAAAFIKNAKKHAPTFGCWLDMEDADNYKARTGARNATKISKICQAWCTEVENAGYYTGIYSSKSWFGTHILNCDRWAKWVAAWGTNNGQLQVDTSSMGPLQQFTSKPVDQDVCYADPGVFKGKNNAPTPAGTADELAIQVLSGAYGNGDARKAALGSRYSEVQKRVNAYINAADEIKQIIKIGSYNKAALMGLL